MINVFWTPVIEYFTFLILRYFYLDTLLHKCTWLKGLDIFFNVRDSDKHGQKMKKQNLLPSILHLMQLRNNQWTW